MLCLFLSQVLCSRRRSLFNCNPIGRLLHQRQDQLNCVHAFCVTEAFHPTLRLLLFSTLLNPSLPGSRRQPTRRLLGQGSKVHVSWIPYLSHNVVRLATVNRPFSPIKSLPRFVAPSLRPLTNSSDVLSWSPPLSQLSILMVAILNVLYEYLASLLIRPAGWKCSHSVLTDYISGPLQVML